MLLLNMLYASGSEYAIRALTHLAQQPPGQLTLLSDIAEAQDLPPAFLGKILKELVRAGILRSARGPTGGYALVYPPEEINLLRVKEVLEGTADLDRCAVGLEPCTDETPCPLHETFKPLRRIIRRYLTETTIADVSRGFWEKQARLAEQRLEADGGEGG